jgi:hypothetical protein
MTETLMQMLERMIVRQQNVVQHEMAGRIKRMTVNDPFYELAKNHLSDLEALKAKLEEAGKEIDKKMNGCEAEALKLGEDTGWIAANIGEARGYMQSKMLLGLKETKK